MKQKMIVTGMKSLDLVKILYDVENEEIGRWYLRIFEVAMRSDKLASSEAKIGAWIWTLPGEIWYIR